MNKDETFENTSHKENKQHRNYNGWGTWFPASLLSNDGENTMKVGDKVICNTGVSGVIVSIYTPTASVKEIMVRTDDIRLYHAPYSMWRRFND